ncbi:MAG: GAF domain-containing protein [Pseudomonadota bacterium]
MTDADRIADILAAPDPDPALERHLGEIIGHKLFTLMVIDRTTNEAARVYSSHPDAYPVKGRKPLGELTHWGTQVLERGEPYIGYDAADIRSVFFDHETIAALGCASVLNLPVSSDGTVIGTVNLLHEAHWYRPEHATRGAPFAALLVPRYLAWATAAGG